MMWRASAAICSRSALPAGNDFEHAHVSDDTRALLKDPPCAVVVAPVGYAERATRLRRIGVAFDGSPGSEQALATARTLACERGAELSAFEVVPEPLRIRKPLEMDAEIAQLVTSARERLAELPDVKTDTGYGDASEELARYGATVDLLVLGAHKQRLVHRLWGGSTAQRLIDSLPCPVLVLGPDRRERSSTKRPGDPASRSALR